MCGGAFPSFAPAMLVRGGEMGAGVPGSHCSELWARGKWGWPRLGAAKAGGGRAVRQGHVLGGVSEQMPWAGAATGYRPWRSSCRAGHWGRNKGRGPRPSCSSGRVMSSSAHELAALCVATGWQRGRGCIRAPYLSTGFPVFAVAPRARSDSQAAGACVAASLGRDAAEPRGVKPLVLQEPSALQSSCPTALALLA